VRAPVRVRCSDRGRVPAFARRLVRDRTFENVWGACRWNSGSVVADTDLHDVIVFFGRNENLTAMPIVFYGVLHQVLHCQRDHLLVAGHRKRFGNIRFDLKIVPCTQDPGVFQASVEQFPQVELRRTQGQATGVCA
jgi:hypothetical protein